MKYEIITNIPPHPEELQYLFKQTTWAKERTLEGVELLLSGTKNYIVIRDKSKLIGYGRALSDGVYRAVLDDIVVDTSYRKRGIGHHIVKGLLDQLTDVEQIFLNTKPDLEPFYNHHGFLKSKAFTMLLQI